VGQLLTAQAANHIAQQPSRSHARSENFVNNVE